MEFKDIKSLSNSEIMLYKETLRNRFEVLKVEIENKCKELEKLDAEYNKAESELITRQNGIY
jgi:hypothetical protein